MSWEGFVEFAVLRREQRFAPECCATFAKCLKTLERNILSFLAFRLWPCFLLPPCSELLDQCLAFLLNKLNHIQAFLRTLGDLLLLSKALSHPVCFAGTGRGQIVLQRALACFIRSSLSRRLSSRYFQRVAARCRFRSWDGCSFFLRKKLLLSLSISLLGGGRLVLYFAPKNSIRLQVLPCFLGIKGGGEGPWDLILYSSLPSRNMRFWKKKSCSRLEPRDL